MVRYALPGFSNNWLVQIKATALVSVIGLQDLVYNGFVAGRSTRQLFTFMFAVLMIYLVLTAVSDAGLRWLEDARDDALEPLLDVPVRQLRLLRAHVLGRSQELAATGEERLPGAVTTSPTLALNRARVQHYITSGDAEGFSNRVWFDDVVVSTSPVGSSPSEFCGSDSPKTPTRNSETSAATRASSTASASPKAPIARSDAP